MAVAVTFFAGCAAAPPQSDRDLAHWQTFANSPASDLSCAYFTRLANDRSQPESLHWLAQVRTLDHCLSPAAAATSALDSGWPSWLKETALRAELKNAQALNPPKHDREIELRFMLLNFEKRNSAKTAELQSLVKLADDTNAPEVLRHSIQQELLKVAPRLIQNPPPEKWLEVANDFKTAREFALARSYYEKVLSSTAHTDDEKLRALDSIRQTYKFEHMREKFLAVTEQYAAFAREHFFKPTDSLQDIEKFWRARLNLARTVWTDGAADRANTVLLETESLVRERGFLSTEESLYLRARIAEEQNHLDVSLDLFNQIKITELVDRDLVSKVEWFHVWLLIKNKKLDEAIDHLNRLIAADENGSSAARYHYWRARSRQQLGDPARDDQEWLKMNDSLGWYSLLASRDLGTFKSSGVDLSREKSLLAIETKPADSTLDTSKPERKQDFVSAQDLRDFNALLSVKETLLAARFLDSVTQPSRSFYSTEQWLKWVDLMQKTERFEMILARLYEMTPYDRRTLLARDPRAVFAQPYSAIVHTAALKYDVPEALIYAVMRQESSFNATARSNADAFGLMQLLPSVADELSATTQIKIAHHEDLYQPEINIPLAAALLKKLLTQWRGSLISTIASYNATESAVAGWVRTRFHGDAISFIEEIPYEETRTYVKLVLRNYIFYRRLESNQPNLFPEECLSSLQTVEP